MEHIERALIAVKVATESVNQTLAAMMDKDEFALRVTGKPRKR